MSCLQNFQERGLQPEQAAGADHRGQRPQGEVLGLAQFVPAREDPCGPLALGLERQVQPQPRPARR